MNANKIVNPQMANDPEYRFTWSICLNPEDNGGEVINLLIDVFHNGEGYWYNTRLTTDCYGIHSSEIFLGSGIDPFELATTILNLGRED